MTTSWCSSENHMKSSLPSDSICKRPMEHTPINNSMGEGDLNSNNYNNYNRHNKFNEFGEIEDDQSIPQIYESNPKMSSL